MGEVKRERYIGQERGWRKQIIIPNERRKRREDLKDNKIKLMLDKSNLSKLTKKYTCVKVVKKDFYYRRFSCSSITPSSYREWRIFWSFSIFPNSSSLCFSSSLRFSPLLGASTAFNASFFFFSIRFARFFSSLSSFFLKRWWDFPFVTAESE